MHSRPGRETSPALPAAAEAALLDAVLAHAPAPIALCDGDGRLLRVNEKLAALVGVGREEALGRTVADVLGVPDGALDAALRHALHTGEAAVGVPLGPGSRSAPGARRDRRASLYGVHDSRGAPLGVVLVVEDHTERVEAEHARARLRQEAEAARRRAAVAAAEAEALRRRTEVLAAAVTRRRAFADADTELQELVSAAVPGLADVAALAVVGGDGVLRASAVACAESALAALARRALGRWPERPDATTGAVRVVRTGEPELVREVGDAHLAAAARDEEHLAALRALGLRSWLIVPLDGREHPIGALTLAQASSRRSFTPDDVPVAAGLASRAALQLENARLATERAEVARTLQARLLPRALPQIPGLELAARYRPAGDATVIGGDFYDVFGNGDGTWTVLIGDVSGKGAEAAALTSLMRYTLRGAPLREPSPAANLALLNDVLLAEADGARFCTALAVRLEVAQAGRARATVACAGRLPPFLLRPDGGPHRLAVHGTLLGALPQPHFAELQVPLVRGDVLLLHTDGVTDLRGAEPEEGERRLERVLARHAGRDAATIVAAVQRSAVGAQDGRPRDDIAIVGLRVV